MRDLQREDFQVIEDGKPRRILEFSASATEPLSIGVLFDTSGSMGLASNLMKGRDVVSRLLERLEPTRDEVALFTFNKVLREEVSFTKDSAAVRTALQDVRPWGVTSLYDAVAETARRLSDRSTSRRAVVVITDGLDTSSTFTSQEAAMLASAIDVPVYVVSVVSPLDDPSHDSSVVAPTAAGGLRNLADFSGGDAFHVSAFDTSGAVDVLLSALRHQYFLAIESSSVPGSYALQVETKRRGLRVKARRGYSTDVANGLQ